jgi:hypothetical protein
MSAASTHSSMHNGGRLRGSRAILATAGDFFDQPRVADAVSDLFRDIFGTDKMAVRPVIDASLPLGMPIELEVTFEVE